jgi:CRISPR system Cascade subunit CasB
MTPQSRDDRDGKFVEFLKSLADNGNRGALAALRRGLSSEGAATVGMHRYVAGWLHEKDRPWDEQRFYLVAALFGRYPCTNTPGHNFGGSYRQLQLRKESESLERRFVALLAADADSVGVHLRHAISLLAAEDIAVDWAELLGDLRWWGQSEHRVQRRWARTFWKHSVAAASESDEPQEQIQQDADLLDR